MSDLPVTVALVSQQQHSTIALGKFLQCAANGSPTLDTENPLVRGGRCVLQIYSVTPRLEQTEPPLPGAPVVAQKIVGHRAHPATRIIRQRSPLVESHEDFLRQIVGEIGVTCQPAQATTFGPARQSSRFAACPRLLARLSPSGSGV